MADSLLKPMCCKCLYHVTFIVVIVFVKIVKLKLKLKIFIGMSAKLIANGHVQIYKYTEYGQ